MLKNLLQGGIEGGGTKESLDYEQNVKVTFSGPADDNGLLCTTQLVIYSIYVVCCAYNNTHSYRAVLALGPPSMC